MWLSWLISLCYCCSNLITIVSQFQIQYSMSTKLSVIQTCSILINKNFNSSNGFIQVTLINISINEILKLWTNNRCDSNYCSISHLLCEVSVSYHSYSECNTSLFTYILSVWAGHYMFLIWPTPVWHHSFYWGLTAQSISAWEEIPDESLECIQL